MRSRTLALPALLTALIVLSAPPAAAVDDRSVELEVGVYLGLGGTTVDLCASDDGEPVDLLDPAATVAALADLWPAVDVGTADEGFDCIYLEIEISRDDLATGDGFVAAVEVPSLAPLRDLGYAEVHVDVCAIPVEVTVRVEPSEARAPDGCFDGDGTSVSPDLASRTELTVRASDAFLRGRLLRGASVVVAVLVAAALAYRGRRRLAVRWFATSRPTLWLAGVGIGVLAALIPPCAALVSGLLDAVELRSGSRASLLVAIALGAPVVVVAVAVTGAVGRARRDPVVAAEARRRGTAPPARDDVPEDLALLTPPPVVSVPSSSWSILVAQGPTGMIWAAAMAALWVDEAGPLAVLALAGATLGTVLLGLRDATLVAVLRPRVLEPSGHAAMLATAAELGCPLRDVVQATVALPTADAPTLGLVVGRRLVLSPVLAGLPPRRAVLVGLTGAAEPVGLLGAWVGIAGLVTGAWLELAWWVAVPVAVLSVVTVRWLAHGPGTFDVGSALSPEELVVTGVEASWWTVAESFGMFSDLVDADGDEDGEPDPDGDVDPSLVWPLEVDSWRVIEQELGASSGTAVATARRLAAEAHRPDGPQPASPSASM
ncbi:hypothetical protein [Nitriliruptor alkaliphilus]|uniref:hypothetical protein n=1 Tax=Nitriliruptor alkaliphilus TaxID=427918 RepID=UPI000695BA5E|nr:hypothetical protein [Nitriliruptor alkaliphilus]